MHLHSVQRFSKPAPRVYATLESRCYMGPEIAWSKDPAGNVLSVLQEKK